MPPLFPLSRAPSEPPGLALRKMRVRGAATVHPPSGKEWVDFAAARAHLAGEPTPKRFTPHPAPGALLFSMTAIPPIR
ncbi:MAG: hypothetical protein AVDCRST_MAG68-3745 [uncultured Gemmatimonadetes bacterium]|uniref:Uncharacterized protein n=1 Tax=uncultured Gemmatimonadota bacterium TaxID=203437 RepID=A0A6J4M9Y1_9BACT|nr:MAG: hypothetical protein AVDCRST_MAG68-3745 [uncultured Gemmatimonadota bacterium]